MLVAPRIALVACLAAALLLGSVAAASARPDSPTASAAVAKKKLSKRARACRKAKRHVLVLKRKRASTARKRVAARRVKRLCKKPRKHAAPGKDPSGQSPSSAAPGGGAAAPGSSTASPTPTPSPGDVDPYGHDVPPLPESNPHALQVVSGEFFLNLSRSGVLSGPVRVEFNNAYAEDPHDLHLVREDGSGQSYAFGQLESGQIEAKTLDLSKGTWQLFCALPQHASYGMTATLRVTDG